MYASSLLQSTKKAFLSNKHYLPGILASEIYNLRANHLHISPLAKTPSPRRHASPVIKNFLSRHAPQTFAGQLKNLKTGGGGGGNGVRFLKICCCRDAIHKNLKTQSSLLLELTACFCFLGQKPGPIQVRNLCLVLTPSKRRAISSDLNFLTAPWTRHWRIVLAKLIATTYLKNTIWCCYYAPICTESTSFYEHSFGNQEHNLGILA